MTAASPFSILVSIARAPASLTDEVRAFLADTAHGMLGSPGIHSARLYADLEGAPSWISLHDVTTEDAADALEALRARETESPGGPALLGQLLQREYGIYSPVGACAASNADHNDIAGEIVSCVWWETRPGTEGELRAWYDGEHIPLLMTIPGWLRIRRFELSHGDSPRFFAVHDIADVRALGDPARQRIRTTPWRTAILESRTQYDSRMYRAQPG